MIEVKKINVSVKVDSEELNVVGIMLENAVDSIPKAEISCAPSGGGKEGITAVRPSVSEYYELYKRLSSKSEGLNVTGSIHIEVESADGTKDEVDLNDWVLAGAGMSSVSTLEAPKLVVVMKHPICRLTKLGGIYETPRSTAFDGELIKTIKSSNGKITDLMDRTYKFMAGLPDSSFMETYVGSGSKSTASEYRKALKDKENLPSTYLDDQTLLFLGNSLPPQAHPMMKMAEGLMAAPRTNNMTQTTWDTIRGVCGEMMITVCQDKDNNYTTPKLVIKPASPWGEPALSISDDMCSWFDLPGEDPYRIIGVMVDMNRFSLGVDEGSTGDRGADKNKKYCAIYISEKANSSQGRILRVSAPQLYLSMFNGDKAAKSSRMSRTENFVRPAEKAVSAYAKALYQLSARSMVRSGMQLALTFRDRNGELLVPGQVCTLSSDEKVIYYGYVSKVVHHLSTSGQCTTDMELSYVTPSGSCPGVKSGSRNAAYYNE